MPKVHISATNIDFKNVLGNCSLISGLISDINAKFKNSATHYFSTVESYGQFNGNLYDTQRNKNYFKTEKEGLCMLLQLHPKK